MEDTDIIREIADVIDFQSDNDSIYTASCVLLKLKELGVICDHS